MARLFLSVLALLEVAAALPGPRNDVLGIRSQQPILKVGIKASDIIPNIISGEEAGVGEFPFQISIQVTDRLGQKFHNCGGCIYNENTIITAAHCVKGYDPTTLQVVAGDHDIFIEEGTEQVRNVQSYIYNPYFDKPTLDNDTAIIWLDRPLVFNNRVQPIALIQPGEEPTGTCVNSGWGNTNPGNPPQYAEKLQKVYLDIIDRDTCTDQYQYINKVTPGMVCAGGTGGKASCNGDSGGPLICKNSKGEDVLAGLVSWGVSPCGQDQFPSVYANVVYFYSWLTENL
ncbi:unnamed protein product [Allacma fusca]|uniref:Peptidase S1 domain-containing protein n=1 Tax=Allacma fusca TaxID=39272 RepID=A0A8J2LHX3_9HEXA|nr:unnamed protein product [Allacma fusca]